MSAPVQVPDATACYYVLNGAYAGPVTEAELESLHERGVLLESAQVRTPRVPGWESFGEWRAHRDQPDGPPARPDGARPGGSDDGADPAADTDPRHSCAGCKKEWPESLMLMDARRWLCRGCFYQQAMKAKRKREAKRRDWWGWLRLHWKGLLAVVLSLVAAGFLVWHYRRDLPFDFFDAEEPAEPWVTDPVAQWPTLVFTNYADFNGHSPLRGQGLFFVRRGDNTVLAGTAAHLLTSDVGVVPDMAPSELENSLKAWWAYPAGAPEQAVALGGLHGPPAALRGFDMLFLKLAAGANVKAVTPLRLAVREVHGGQKVFVVAPSTPADPKSAAAARQTVYAGWVHVRDGGGKSAAKDGTLLDVHVDPAFVPRHLAGSPVIDERGHLVGLVKGWGDALDAAGLVDTVVAQGAAAFRDLLEPKVKPDAKLEEQNRAEAKKMDQALKALLDK